MPRPRRQGRRAAFRPGPTALSALVVALCLAGSAVLAGVPGGGGSAAATPPDPMTLDPASAITFNASDALGGFDGKVPIASFSGAIDPQRLESVQASILAKADAITTGNFLRDVNAHRTVFETSRFPDIRYTVSSVQADPDVLRDGHSVDLTVRGQLRMHGVQRQVVAHGQASRDGQQVEAKLSLPLRLSDFDMKRPRIFTVVVDDTIDVDVHLQLRIGPSGG